MSQHTPAGSQVSDPPASLTFARLSLIASFSNTPSVFFPLPSPAASLSTLIVKMSHHTNTHNRQTCGQAHLTDANGLPSACFSINCGSCPPSPASFSLSLPLSFTSWLYPVLSLPIVLILTVKGMMCFDEKGKKEGKKSTEGAQSFYSELKHPHVVTCECESVCVSVCVIRKRGGTLQKPDDKITIHQK